MQNTERAVVRLTETHTEHTDAGPVEWPPLLEWLQARVTDVTRRGGGTGGQGIPLNDDALAILDHVRVRTKLLGQALALPLMGDVIADTTALWRKCQDERAGGRMGDKQWEAISDEFPDWVHRIECEQEKPRKMELTVPCPRCDTRWMVDALQRRVAAVIVEFSPDRAPVAECRVDGCAAMWAGWAEVARLGFTVGAVQDQAVLAACGIDAPQMLNNIAVIR